VPETATGVRKLQDAIPASQEQAELVKDTERREQWLAALENDLRRKTYRPKRKAQQAIDAIKVALLEGRREVVDADLAATSTPFRMPR